MITALTQKFNMKHHKITAYHPQANGLVERFNGTLKKTLAKIWNLYSVKFTINIYVKLNLITDYHFRYP